MYHVNECNHRQWLGKEGSCSLHQSGAMTEAQTQMRDSYYGLEVFAGDIDNDTDVRALHDTLEESPWKAMETCWQHRLCSQRRHFAALK